MTPPPVWPSKMADPLRGSKQTSGGVKFSQRVNWDLNPNRFTVLVEKKRKIGTRLLDLVQFNPTLCSFNSLGPEILAPLTQPRNLIYEPDPHGLAEAREAVCRYYAAQGIGVAPEQIFITAGTSEAYSFVFRLLADPGDAVLVPRPSYPLFEFLARLEDVRIGNYSLIYKNGWQIDANELEMKIRTHPKAIVMVNPNNPTGHFINEEDRRMICELCAVSDTALISDEVFFDFKFPGEARHVRSFAGEDQVLTFTLSGISKILGLPQMKLSWMVASGPASQVQEATKRLEIVADTYLSANTPSQRSLGEWLEKRGRILREINERLASNRGLLADRLGSHQAFHLLHSEGGWYAVLRIESDWSDEELATHLLEKQDTLVHPGYFYDLDGHFLVLSLLGRPDELEEGIARILKGVSELKPKPAVL